MRNVGVTTIATFLLLSSSGCSGLMLEHLYSSSRDVWQQPDAVIQSLSIPPDARVADLGAGGGYFTFRLAEAVGPQGRVYAVDIDRDDLQDIAQRAPKQGFANVTVVQASEADPRLPESSVDLIFTCNTVHHLENRVDYFRSAGHYLRQDGRIAIIDYLPIGFAWLFGHGTAKEQIRREMGAAGYYLTDEFDYLPKQHFQVFRRKE